MIHCNILPWKTQGAWKYCKAKMKGRLRYLILLTLTIILRIPYLLITSPLSLIYKHSTKTELDNSKTIQLLQPNKA